MRETRRKTIGNGLVARCFVPALPLLVGLGPDQHNSMDRLVRVLHKALFMVILLLFGTVVAFPLALGTNSPNVALTSNECLSL